MSHEIMLRSGTTSIDEASSEALKLLIEAKNFALKSWGRKHEGMSEAVRARVINEKLCITHELIEIMIWLNHLNSHDHHQQGGGIFFPHEDGSTNLEPSADVRTGADQWLPKELRSIRNRMHRLYPRLVQV